MKTALIQYIVHDDPLLVVTDNEGFWRSEYSEMHFTCICTELPFFFKKWNKLQGNKCRISNLFHLKATSKRYKEQD